MIIRGGGLGAGCRTDGHHCAIFPANGANTPVEIFESDTPLIVEARELVADSGGPGKQRGGLGRRMVLRVPNDALAPMPPVTIAVQAGRFRYPPQGMFGGKAGIKASFLKNDVEADPSGLTFADPGDTIAFYSAGGGGFGDPFEREIDAVEQDVQFEYISVEDAEKEYGVIVNPVTRQADRTATELLRKAKRGENR
jgi:N-methylhydantoinase B